MLNLELRFFYRMVHTKIIRLVSRETSGQSHENKPVMRVIK